MDCQVLLNHFTQYEILDAYATQHLPYESELTRAYGFVPCIGSPFGNVAYRRDPQTGEVVGDAVTATTLFFHYHCHEMNPVPLDIKAKSLYRFYEQRNNNSNHYNQQQQQQPLSNNNSFAGNSYRHFNNNNTASQQSTPSKMHQQRNVLAAPRSSTLSQQQPQQQRGFATHKRVADNSNHQFYTAYDAQLAAASVAFTDAAQLGR